MGMKTTTVIRTRRDFKEVVDWCKQTFSGDKNGRYDVYPIFHSTNDPELVRVVLQPYTEEAATLIALRWS
jgi:hypothetical protein